jgi:hypothetical protein
MYHLRRTVRPRERDAGTRRRRAAWRGRRPLVTLGLSKVTRPGPKGGRNPVEGSALASHAAKPHQGANRWFGNPARVCRRGTDDFLRCNVLRLLHPTVFHCAVKPRHHINSANVRIRCAIRTYGPNLAGNANLPSPQPSPEGRGGKTPRAASGDKRRKKGSRSGSLSHGYGVVMRTGRAKSQIVDPIPDLIYWSPPSSLPQTPSDE